MITVIKNYDGMQIKLEAKEGSKDIKVTWILSDKYHYSLGSLTVQEEVTESLINRVCHTFLGSEQFEDAVEFKSEQVLEHSQDEEEIRLMDKLVTDRVNRRIAELGGDMVADFGNGVKMYTI